MVRLLATIIFPSHTVLSWAKSSSSFKIVQESSEKVLSHSIPNLSELVSLLYFIADREDIFNNLSVLVVLASTTRYTGQYEQMPAINNQY